MSPKNGVSGLYHLEPLLEIVETVIFTACVKDEKPTSIIITGPSGSAKSLAITRYVGDSFRKSDSVTSQGLYDIAISDPKGIIKFLQIPDMNPTLSRKPSTVQSTIANLLSFTADGMVRIDDGRQQKECKHDPIGVITAATDDIYKQQAKKWFALGLRRRILPVFFKYTNETTQKLQALVREEKIHSVEPPKVRLSIGFQARPEIPSSMTHKIEGLSLKFSTLLGKLYSYDQNVSKRWYVREVVPVSPQITLMNLCRAHALRRDKKTPACAQEDYDFLARFLDFCDPEHPKEI